MNNIIDHFKLVPRFCFVCRSYYMLMLWFPELMNRFLWYETLYTGFPNMTTMCEIVSLYKIEPDDFDGQCNDDIDESVYVNIVIIGIACIPTSLIVPLFVNKLGIRFFLGSETLTQFFFLLINLRYRPVPCTVNIITFSYSLCAYVFFFFFCYYTQAVFLSHNKKT